jgi:hypothetical protein
MRHTFGCIALSCVHTLAKVCLFICQATNIRAVCAHERMLTWLTQVLDDMSESSEAPAANTCAASAEYACIDRDLAAIKEQLDDLKSYPIDTDVVTADNKYGTVLRVYPPAQNRNEVCPNEVCPCS